MTTKARSKIRQFLKNLRTEESVVLGRRLLNHALGAKNIEDIPEARVKQVLADTKHENLGAAGRRGPWQRHERHGGTPHAGR